MLEFILDHLVLIFSCEPIGMGMVSMGLVSQVFYVLAALSESLKVAVDAAESDVFFFANLLRSFLVLQDGTDQFISLNCIHGVASQNLTVDIIFTEFWRQL